jgi:hypothetical protein
LLDERAIQKLIYSWNNYFDKIQVEDSYTVDDLTIDNIFNSYLASYSSTLSFEYTDNICTCEKQNSKIIVTYYKNKICTDEFDIRSKRKFYNLINNFDYIITNNLPISAEALNKTKVLLRYELIRNIFTSNHTHFFSKDLPFSVDDNSVFMTKLFLQELTSRKERLDKLRFSSYLLNQFELGVTIDNLILKPSISISPYGRWYWSGTEKVQNDLKSRERIFNKLLKYGKILNIDLISGEPMILSQLSNSSLLNKLLKYRISIKKKDPELSTILKNLINIYIHSVTTPEEAYYKFKANNNYKLVETKLGIPVIDILAGLQDDFLWYNKKVIDNYRQNLSCDELSRRIVNPGVSILSENDIIKEHRKFLQGHTHDKILDIAMLTFKELNILPIFTVHDSLTYFISNSENLLEVKDIIKKNAKLIKTPITLEVLE